ncbi:prolipoprotein diacylglyceryl transferase [Spiroplasma helicoides]|uniref:Prolipoprotein diacylglyceryl transferase n=1 Tax=Spiroplasma helicoides TaxID=216938 RepID=A0A1B3SJD1_9MOLU|nr:prolipoprotein diacylglyceryl transferase family protein [Spiroplasma helicoides]AOG60038.1 prolipoprotein diacylglyceryl transferase [Spiroplasma helicoides]
MEYWLDEWFQSDSSKWTIKSDYGFLHVYALTMTLGVLAAIALACYQMWRKKLPLQDILIAAIFIVPSGLFVASFFGKLNSDGKSMLGNYGFFGLFAFWKEGMSIHGAILGGGIAALISLYFLGRRTRISVFTYADCVAPGILISQSIGRWGNFFNHELTGKPIGIYGSDALSNMPKWLQDNLAFKATAEGIGKTLNGFTLEDNVTYVMQPLFLYESVSFLFLYLFIVLFIPGIGKWVGKKPWKVHPETYNLDWKKSWKYAFTWNKSLKDDTYFQIWRDAYFTKVETNRNAWYEQKLLEISATNKIKKRWLQGKALLEANNPDGYSPTRVGVQCGAYFLCWNLVRFFIEIDRSQEGFFVMYNFGLSIALIVLTGLFGLILIILAQFISPYLTRRPGCIYEKPYFYTEQIVEEVINKSSNSIFKKSKKVEQSKIEEKRKKALEKLEKLSKQNNSSKDQQK